MRTRRGPALTALLLAAQAVACAADDAPAPAPSSAPPAAAAPVDESGPPLQHFDPPRQTQTLEQYAADCDAAIGATVPDFNCDDGTLVPTTHHQGEACDRPSRLNRQCDPDSRFQVLTRSDDAYVVAMCRKGGLGAGQYRDIAVIQYSRQNGSTCFYQANGTLDGRTKAPSRGAAAWSWKAPVYTARDKCASCHDNGPFIRSPFLTQLTGVNSLPGAGDTGFNRNQPYRFVGSDFASWRVAKVEVQGNYCNSCHRLGLNNVIVGWGTALDFAQRATAQWEQSKNAHSPDSPIWMPPGGIYYNASNQSSARAIADCGLAYQAGQPLPAGCSVTDFTAPPPAQLASVSVSGASAAAYYPLNHQLEVVRVRPNGQQGLFWKAQDGGWQSGNISGPGFTRGGAGSSTVFYPPGNQLETFAVGADGRLWVRWKSQNGAWQEGGPISDALFPVGAAVSAVYYPLRQQLEVFAVGNDGRVWDTSKAYNGSFSSTPVTPAGWWARPGSRLAASYHPLNQQLEVFTVGGDKRIYVIYKAQDGAWAAAWLTGSEFPEDASVTSAYQPLNQQLEVFAVDDLGRVNLLWKAQNGSWQRGFLTPTAYAWPGAWIASVFNPLDSRLEVVLFEVDNRPWLLSKQQNGSWGSQLLLTDRSVFDPSTRLDAVFYPLDNQVMVFGQGRDGNLKALSKRQNGGWGVENVAPF